MERLPRAHFLFFMNLAYVHPGVLLNPRFVTIRLATRAELRQLALETAFLGD